MLTERYDRFVELMDRCAVGETLSEREQDFCADVAAEDPVAQAEIELLEQFDLGEVRLDGFQSGADVVAGALRAAAASERVVLPFPVRRVVAGGMFAAAAAAAAWLWTGESMAPADSRTVAGIPAPPPAASPFVITTSMGKLELDGVEVSASTGVLRGGATLRAMNGSGCFRVEQVIDVCLGEHTAVSLPKPGKRARTIELLDGEVVVALPKQTEANRFSIVSGDTRVTAIGTVFSVAVRAGVVETNVTRGTIDVGNTRGTLRLPAPGSARSAGSAVEATEFSQVGAGSAWDAMRTLRQSDDLGLATPRPRAIDHSVDTETGSRGASPTPETPSRVVPRAIGPSASQFLGMARSAMAERDWTSAAASYRQLRSGYPNSPEARTVMVPLAQLELSHLGNAQGALRLFEGYLETGGGPLALEARLGRVQALHRIGLVQHEAAAIRDLLSHHPDAIQAGSLRQRLEQLAR